MSCQTTPNLVIYESPKTEDLNRIKSFVSGTQYTHIKLNCAILDFNLNVVTLLSKYGVCYFDKNGHSVVWNNESLVAYDETLKIKWQKGPIKIHHLIEKSVFSDDILTIASRYAESRDYGLLRYDELLVFNPKGDVVKSFKFESYFKKYPESLIVLPKVNDWTKDKHYKKTYELNHGNSFSELYTEKDGKRTHTGYVFYCKQQLKIFIFDRELKKIVKILNTRRPLHTVRQYGEHHLIAYENADENDVYTSIQLISLDDGSYSTLYESKNSTLSSIACSSVQVLPDNKLFIVHSKCFAHPKLQKDAEGYFLEFVDLKTKKSFAFHVDTGFAQQAGELINAEEYLKKNIGQ